MPKCTECGKDFTRWKNIWGDSEECEDCYFDDGAVDFDDDDDEEELDEDDHDDRED
jgi:hypothetical protein